MSCLSKVLSLKESSLSRILVTPGVQSLQEPTVLPSVLSLKCPVSPRFQYLRKSSFLQVIFLSSVLFVKESCLVRRPWSLSTCPASPGVCISRSPVSRILVTPGVQSLQEPTVLPSVLSLKCPVSPRFQSLRKSSFSRWPVSPMSCLSRRPVSLEVYAVSPIVLPLQGSCISRSPVSSGLWSLHESSLTKSPVSAGVSLSRSRDILPASPDAILLCSSTFGWALGNMLCLYCLDLSTKMFEGMIKNYVL